MDLSIINSQVSADKKTQTARVAVALSGGVDSLYSMLELKASGLDVIGVHGIFAQKFLHGLESNSEERRLGEKELQLIDKLTNICEQQGIPFHVLDCSDAFLQEVISFFVTSYAHGLTPNPCALCNRHIKFGLFQEKALSYGADYMASGHYVRVFSAGLDNLFGASGVVFFDPVVRKLAEKKEIYFTDPDGERALELFPLESLAGGLLLQALDHTKEQSYFLSLAKPQALAKSVFPMGGKIKKEIVQDLAGRGVIVPQNSESQEVCFISDEGYRVFLEKAAQSLQLSLGEEGTAMLPDGKVVGKHYGLWRYTQGQRKGLGLSWSEPLYVVEKDLKQNRLIVSPYDGLGVESFTVHSLNFFVDMAYWPSRLYVKTRYRQELKKVNISMRKEDGELYLDVYFEDKEQSVAPGQIAAFYAGIADMQDESGGPVLALLAGGIIS